jgi:hypothetical protein
MKRRSVAAVPRPRAIRASITDRSPWPEGSFPKGPSDRARSRTDAPYRELAWKDVSPPRSVVSGFRAAKYILFSSADVTLENDVSGHGEGGSSLLRIVE